MYLKYCNTVLNIEEEKTYSSVKQTSFYLRVFINFIVMGLEKYNHWYTYMYVGDKPPALYNKLETAT